MLRGSDLKEWRKRMGYTQEALRLELGIASRQTIISWERAEEPLARVIELALIALEHLPKSRTVWGNRMSPAEVKEVRERSPRCLDGIDLSLEPQLAPRRPA
jgi:transcriptional regulator with XRE-family HTH domain